jgi:hypothetical protein
MLISAFAYEVMSSPGVPTQSDRTLRTSRAQVAELSHGWALDVTRVRRPALVIPGAAGTMREGGIAA